MSIVVGNFVLYVFKVLLEDRELRNCLVFFVMREIKLYFMVNCFYFDLFVYNYCFNNVVLRK